MTPGPSAALRTLSPGDSIRVKTAEDGVVLGRFERLEGNALVVAVSGDTDAEVPLDAIVRVTRGQPRTRRYATTGALAGVILPLLVAGNSYFTLALLVGAVLALGLGTLGALLGAFGGYADIVYEAPR